MEGGGWSLSWQHSSRLSSDSELDHPKGEAAIRSKPEESHSIASNVLIRHRRCPSINFERGKERSTPRASCPA